ncbi:thermonuclease family protein [Apibacter muscae]|nr:thermonuclease family protein [Apibacter muscae]
MKKLKPLFFLLSFLVSTFLLSQTLSGRVIKVADGDTVTILTDENEQIKIRLYGIDCPEKGQDFSSKATAFTSSFCFGKIVKVTQKGLDRYGRVLGIILIGKKNLNEELLKNGLAWHYKYFDKTQKYVDLEQEAKNNKLNIWSMNNPIAPWDFRKKPKKR